MHDDLLATDSTLQPSQRRLLAALLDTLLPGDGSQLPPASETAFEACVATQAPHWLPELVALLEHVGEGFLPLDPEAREGCLQAFAASEPDRFAGFLLQAYACYYQDPRVQTAIGMGAGAPFPRGNRVIPGDLELLDTVVAGQHGWRRI